MLAGKRFMTFARISGWDSQTRNSFAPAGFAAPTGTPMVQPPPRLTLSGDRTTPHLRFGFCENVSNAFDDEVSMPTLLASNNGWISRVVVKFGVPSGVTWYL